MYQQPDLINPADFNEMHRLKSDEELKRAQNDDNMDEAQMNEEDQKRKMQDQLGMQMMMDMNGRQSVPMYNKHEAQGRTGLVDPALVQQQTQLPEQRRYDQAANHMAILRSLPPDMMQTNMSIVQQVEQSLPEIYRRMKMPDTIYQQYPRDFVVNRVNLAIRDRRQNSIYGLI